MMAPPKPATILGRRLERLTGDKPATCLPKYVDLAKEVVRSPRFKASLLRAKALADQNRLLAATLLNRQGELCACEIQAITGLSHPTVSHHMNVLVEAGLVTARREGKWVYYRIVGGKEVALP